MKRFECVCFAFQNDTRRKQQLEKIFGESRETADRISEPQENGEAAEKGITRNSGKTILEARLHHWGQ